MKARHKRLVFVAIAIVGVGIAAALALSALQSNIAYFFSPSQVLAGEAPRDKVIRVGGMVAKGSLKRASQDLTATFVVTDTAQDTQAEQDGPLRTAPGVGEGSEPRPTWVGVEPLRRVSSGASPCRRDTP